VNHVEVGPVNEESEDDGRGVDEVNNASFSYIIHSTPLIEDHLD
jgi:hypothetical protein